MVARGGIGRRRNESRPVALAQEPRSGHLHIFRDVDAAGLCLGLAIHSGLPVIAKVGPEQNSCKSGGFFASLVAAKIGIGRARRSRDDQLG